MRSTVSLQPCSWLNPLKIIRRAQMLTKSKLVIYIIDVPEVSAESISNRSNSTNVKIAPNI